MNKEELIAFEEGLKTLWHEGKIKCPHHFCGGNEDVLIKYFKDHVGPKDWVFSTHRSAYHWLLKTGDTEFLMDQILNKNNSMHIIDLKRRFISTAIVGGGCGPAVGTARAIYEAGDNERVHCFVGDGAMDQGWFWEAIRYAIGWELPIVFIIEDNNRSVCTDKATRWGKMINIDSWPHIFRYEYKATYPHCGDGRAIEW